MRRRALLALVLIAAPAGWLAPAASAQPASVVVDGRIVTFDQPPAIIGGRLLIPLRGVFEQLGAQVEWQPSGGIIVARRGATAIVLRPGNRTARVDDRPVTLDVPAVIVNGHTLVPLRFVGEALGAKVEWEPVNRVVYVTSPGQTGPPALSVPPLAPAPPAPVTPASIDGTVVRVEPYTAPPRLHLLSQGALSILPVAPDASFFVTEVSTGRGGPASLEQIRRGDYARVLVDPQGLAISIQASYRRVTGRLERLANRRLILADGQVFPLGDEVFVTLDGRAVGRDALRPGMIATFRLNPRTNAVWEIHAQTPAAPASPVPPPPAAPPPPPVVVPPPVVPAPVVVRIDAVGLSAPGPFGIGATLTVTMRGTPGGEAFVDIGQSATSLRMQEGPAGNYAVGYTVRPGEAARAQVVVRLRLGGVEVSRAIGAVVLDGLPPVFTHIEPEADSVVTSAQPAIVVGFADRGPAGIRTDSVRLWVDGREERRAAVNASSVSYVPPPLSNGRHRVQVMVADLAGNEASTSWTFVVSVPPPLTPTPAPTTRPPVASPTPRPSPAPPLPGASPTVRPSPTPGVAPPVILSPKPGDAIPTLLSVRGSAMPGARVQVTIDYESTSRPGLRGTLGPVLATVNQDGSWEVRVQLPDRFGEGRLSVTAVTIAGNLKSEPAKLNIVITIPQRDPEK